MGSKRNRTAGHAWELKCAELLKKYFPFLVTSRSESRSRDNQKIDLINKDEYKNGKCPYNFQCKTTANTLNYSKVFKVMPKEEGINVILHKQTKKAGTNFMPVGQYAIMNLQDFLTLLGPERSQILNMKKDAKTN